MIVQCGNCQTRFRIADERVKSQGLKVRCTRCGQVFVVHRDEAAPAPNPTPVHRAEADIGFSRSAVPDAGMPTMPAAARATPPPLDRAGADIGFPRSEVRDDGLPTVRVVDRAPPSLPLGAPLFRVAIAPASVAPAATEPVSARSPPEPLAPSRVPLPKPSSFPEDRTVSVPPPIALADTPVSKPRPFPDNRTVSVPPPIALADTPVSKPRPFPDDRTLSVPPPIALTDTPIPKPLSFPDKRAALVPPPIALSRTPTTNRPAFASTERTAPAAPPAPGASTPRAALVSWSILRNRHPPEDGRVAAVHVALGAALLVGLWALVASGTDQPPATPDLLPVGLHASIREADGGERRLVVGGAIEIHRGMPPAAVLVAVEVVESGGLVLARAEGPAGSLLTEREVDASPPLAPGVPPEVAMVAGERMPFRLVVGEPPTGLSRASLRVTARRADLTPPPEVSEATY